MATALVSSVDNSPMTTYRRTGGLNTQDIAGARPRELTRERHGLYPQWNEPLNKPRRRHPPHLHTDSKRPVMNLTNKDIPGSMTHGHFQSGRHVDPLEPDYVLPSHEHRPYTPPAKAARDLHLNTTDVEGSSPAKRFPYATRDHITSEDIEGADTGWKPYNTRFFGAGTMRKPGQTATLDVREVNDEGRFRSQRSTNPLEPTYNYDTQNRRRWPGDGVSTPNSAAPPGEDCTIGPIARSKPTPARGLRNDPEYNMMNEMDGAVPGWKPPNAQRRQWARTNYIGDIHGTKSTDSRGPWSDMGPKPFSVRHTNPVDPNYDEARRSTPASLKDRHPILRRGSAASSRASSASTASMPRQDGSPHNLAAANPKPPSAVAPADTPVVALPAPGKPSTPASSAGSGRRAMSARESSAPSTAASSVRSGAQTERIMVGSGGNYGTQLSLRHYERGASSRLRTPGGHGTTSSYKSRPRSGW